MLVAFKLDTTLAAPNTDAAVHGVPVPKNANCGACVPSATAELNPHASSGWSKNIPYDVRNTVLPSFHGSHASPIRGALLLLSCGMPSTIRRRASAAVGLA